MTEKSCTWPTQLLLVIGRAISIRGTYFHSHLTHPAPSFFFLLTTRGRRNTIIPTGITNGAEPSTTLYDVVSVVVAVFHFLF